MTNEQNASAEPTKLDHDTKAAVRAYMLQIFTIGGVLVAVIAGVAGFLVKDLATKTAISDALQKMQAPLMEAYRQVNEISAAASRSVQEAEDSLDAAEKLRENLETLKSYVESEEIRADVVKKLAENSVFRSQVTDAVKGDYAEIRNQITTIENKNQSALEKIQKIDKNLERLRAGLQKPKPYGFYAYRKGWIQNFDEYGTAEIEVKEGDIVKVILTGSARSSNFYYNIVEKTGGAEIIAKPTGPADHIDPEIASDQVILNPTNEWKSIATMGLFKANKSTRLKFKANFKRGTLTNASISVFGLTVIATVVGSSPL